MNVLAAAPELNTIVQLDDVAAGIVTSNGANAIECENVSCCDISR